MSGVIITGPTGAIGHALIDECLAHGEEIYAICRPHSPRIATLPQHPRLHVLQAELSELLTLKDSLPTDCEVCYHLGWVGTFGADARNNMPVQVRNIQYTLDAVELAHACGCHTFVGAGSQAEYGRCNTKLTPTTPTFPENGYGMAKLCAGHMSRMQAHKYGMKHVWARILSVYGPYDGENTMVMSTIRKLLNGEVPQFTPAGQMWDYLYARDAGALMYLLGTPKSVDGKVYVLGSGEARPLRYYIETIRDAINPLLPLAIGALPYNPNQITYLCGDVAETLADLDYELQYSFEAGIKELIGELGNCLSVKDKH